MSRTATDALEDDEVAVEDHESAVVSATLLDQLMDRLKPAQASVIRLVKIDGFSIAEASARTGQSSALVKVNIHRGIAKLTAMVQRQSHAE